MDTQQQTTTATQTKPRVQTLPPQFIAHQRLLKHAPDMLKETATLLIKLRENRKWISDSAYGRMRSTIERLTDIVAQASGILRPEDV